MSGSGKTEMILSLVPELARQRKRVLLVSYSPAMIDALLLRLAAKGFHQFIRITNSLTQVDEKLHRRVIMPEALTKVAELDGLYSTHFVYACPIQ